MENICHDEPFLLPLVCALTTSHHPPGRMEEQRWNEGTNSPRATDPTNARDPFVRSFYCFCCFPFAVCIRFAGAATADRDRHFSVPTTQSRSLVSHLGPIPAHCYCYSSTIQSYISSSGFCGPEWVSVTADVKVGQVPGTTRDLNCWRKLSIHIANM